MIRWISLACAVVVLSAAVPLAYYSLPDDVPEPKIELHRRAPAGPPPRLEVVGPPMYNFGTVGVKVKGRHTWDFKNVGESPLEVWLEETSCSCTIAALKGEDGEDAKKILLQPGRSSPIELSWEGSRPGRFGQSATLGTNDPEKPRITLAVAGRIAAPVDVQPAEIIAVPEISNEETHRETVTVTSLDRADLKLTRVTSTRPGLIVAEASPLGREDLDRLKVKSGCALTVEIRPGLPPGRFTEDLSIETNHPRRPSLKLTITGEAVGPITVRPDRVVMTNVPGHEGGSRSLSIVVRGGKETHFQVVARPEKVDVAITPEAKGRYRVTVTVPAGLDPGLIDTPIVLKTDHPKVAEIKLPVSIFVSSRSEAG